MRHALPLHIAPSSRYRVVSTILILSGMVVATIACGLPPSAEIADLPHLHGLSLQQIADRLGPPSEAQEYTIARAPTKQWNHAILFEAYPKTAPGNRDVRIKELTWNDGDHLIKACLHVVGDEWIVLGASRFHHGTRF